MNVKKTLDITTPRRKRKNKPFSHALADKLCGAAHRRGLRPSAVPANVRRVIEEQLGERLPSHVTRVQASRAMDAINRHRASHRRFGWSIGSARAIRQALKMDGAYKSPGPATTAPLSAPRLRAYPARPVKITPAAEYYSRWGSRHREGMRRRHSSHTRDSNARQHPGSIAVLCHSNTTALCGAGVTQRSREQVELVARGPPAWSGVEKDEAMSGSSK